MYATVESYGSPTGFNMYRRKTAAVARRTPRLRASALSHDWARVRVTTWSIFSARFRSVTVGLVRAS